MGVVLTAYIVVSVFGYVSSSSAHYSTFILAILVMSGLLAIRTLIDRRISNSHDGWFWLWMAIAIAGSLAGLASAGFIRWNAERLETIQPFFEDFDVTVGFVFTGAILVLTWIHWGWLLTLIIFASILYFFFGHNISSILFAHPEYDTKFVMNYLGLGTTQGFFWLAQLAADSIYFLVIYAAILLGVGMLEMVLEVGKACGRRISGGAAFPALIGSGIVASVMGQAVSNVILTGRLTIPMMKRYGYQSAMAGAIEATASTAGQIMPPILGLAGFIIATFLNRPYIDVALNALIPALLYMSGVTFGVVIYANRRNLPKLTEQVNTGMIYRLLPTFVISFATVLWLLLGYRSPSYAGLVGIVVTLVLCLTQGKYRPKWRSFFAAIEEGFVLVTVLSLLLIAIGPLGQVMITTNLSGRLGTVLVQTLPNVKLVLLIGAMVVSLILGMGLPTPVAYIVVALAVVPFMQQIGVPPLQAHFFVFYFAVFSTLTPPVAVSVLAAAKLSGARFNATALDAMKLACTTFIIPFAFVHNPELMAFPRVDWSVLGSIVEVLVIQWAVSVAAYGHLSRNLTAKERWAFALASVFGFAAMVSEHYYWDTLLYATLVALGAWIYVVAPRRRLAAPEAGREQ